MDAIARKDLAQGAQSLQIYYLTVSKKVHKYDTFSYDCIVRKRLQGAREND